MILNRHKISIILSEFFFFTTPVYICTLVLTKVGVIIEICLFLLFGIFAKSRGISLTRYQKYVIILFFLPTVLSMLWSIISLGPVNESLYYEMFTNDMPGRIVNLFILFALFYWISSTIISTPRDRTDVYMKAYYWGVFLILGVFGIWQMISSVTGIWCPEVGTRGDAYFLRDVGLRRLTSLADEPSFLAPFLIEGILLSLYVKNYVISTALCLIIIMSFSLGGYAELALLLLAGLYFSDNKTRTRGLICIVLFVGSLLIFFPEIFDWISLFLNARKELQSGFKAEDSWRTLTYTYPIISFINSDIGSMLFGHGPASFKYLMATVGLGDMFTSSNNMYIDVLYEGGIVSLVSILTLLVYSWKKINLLQTKHNRQETIIAKLFILHIILSSCYRGDYSTPRFISLFLLLICFFKSSQTNLSLHK